MEGLHNGFNAGALARAHRRFAYAGALRAHAESTPTEVHLHRTGHLKEGNGPGTHWLPEAVPLFYILV